MKRWTQNSEMQKLLTFYEALQPTHIHIHTYTQKIWLELLPSKPKPNQNPMPEHTHIHTHTYSTLGQLLIHIRVIIHADCMNISAFMWTVKLYFLTFHQAVVRTFPPPSTPQSVEVGFTCSACCNQTKFFCSAPISAGKTRKSRKFSIFVCSMNNIFVCE